MLGPTGDPTQTNSGTVVAKKQSPALLEKTAIEALILFVQVFKSPCRSCVTW